jgi:methionine biosynthesis protein MetW
MGRAGVRFRNWAEAMWLAAHDENVANIERLLEPSIGNSSLVDLGADDGELTERFAQVVGATEVHGVEIVQEQAQKAAGRGIVIVAADLNEPLPYDDETFDVVCSNQVIEHLANTDRFLTEMFRILKRGGYAVVSTENLSSWHNIGALILGWQPFSLSNVSYRSLGNPLSLHRGETWPWPSWQHVRVFAYRGLRELFAAHSFDVETVLGAGYFPLSAGYGRRDPRHAMFLTVKARRPVNVREPRIG